MSGKLSGGELSLGRRVRWFEWVERVAYARDSGSDFRPSKVVAYRLSATCRYTIPFFKKTVSCSEGECNEE